MRNEEAEPDEKHDLHAGVNSNLSMSSVAFLNNSAGFGGGAMHLSNTMPITPGEAFSNITVVGNSVSAFAAGANIYGGATHVTHVFRRQTNPV